MRRRQRPCWHHASAVDRGASCSLDMNLDMISFSEDVALANNIRHLSGSTLDQIGYR
jgi:hypothetical protein